MRVLIIALFLQGCSSLSCFSIDGRAYSSCLGGKKFKKLCEAKGGLNYYLGQSKGVCNDGTEFN